MQRILLIDDNPSAARLYGRMALACGWELASAANCGEALDLIAARAPDLVLLDIKYPRLLGRAFLDELSRARPGLPVLTLAGNDDEIIAQLVEKLCGAGYLLKPVEPAVFEEAVRSRLPEPEPAFEAAAEPEPAQARASALLGWLPVFSGMRG